MKNYFNQSMRALQLAGMSERTCECYTRSVRQLVEFYNQTPDKISETQLQNYFFTSKKQKQLVCSYFTHLLQRHQVLFCQCS